MNWSFSGSRLTVCLIALGVLTTFTGSSQAKDPVLPASPELQYTSGTPSGTTGAVATSLGQFQIGANFTGSSIGQSGFIPPDTMGAVGPDHVVELINGRYAVYDKSGTFISATSLNTFWTNAGVTTSGFTFDPRILYDPYSQRWFAAAVDNGGNPNNFLIAVSDSSNPLDGWSGAAIDTDSANTRWADFPQLGINGDKVTLSANMFPTSTGSVSTSFLTFDKASLISGTVNATSFQNINANDTGFTPQPVVDLDNNTGPQLILSAYNTPGGTLKLSSISGPGGSATLNTSGGFIAVTARTGPSDADQPGTTAQNIDNGDTRFSGNVVQQNGSLWAVQTVDISGRSAIQWYQIDPNTNAVIQSGLIDDSNLEFYYPSIAVNDDGDVVIGFSGSSDTQYVSAYAAIGLTNAGTTTFTDAMLLKAGVDTYQRLDGSGRNRWGDYSATVIDPSDPTGKTFWTFQEFVNADGVSGVSENVWSVQITQIVIPEPGALAMLGLITGITLLSRRRSITL